MDLIEEVRDATTPAEMRAEIFRLQHYDALVRGVMNSANYTGMSAEDRYTVLAYHALKAKADAQAQILMFARVTPRIFVQPNLTTT